VGKVGFFAIIYGRYNFFLLLLVCGFPRENLNFYRRKKFKSLDMDGGEVSSMLGNQYEMNASLIIKITNRKFGMHFLDLRLTGYSTVQRKTGKKTEPLSNGRKSS
jgi:hypothetical protein